MTQRIVVLLCGPSGAGKTTVARESGLEVFDRDDPEWFTEKQFTTRLADLARDPKARAVVIRSGAASSARARAAQLIAATHTFMLTAEVPELERRIRTRGRPDEVACLRSIRPWFKRFDRDDGVQDFPDWHTILSGVHALDTSEAW